MKKTIFLSCFLIITILSFFILRNQETKKETPLEISSRPIHTHEPDYKKIAAKLERNVDDIKKAFKASESKGSFDLKTIAIKLTVTDKELSDAMGPPPPRDKGQHSRPHTQGSGKIFSSLDTDYGNSKFEITSLAVEKGELLNAYKCEKKVDNKQKSIPLSWDNIPDGTKSLAIIMYHYPHPNDKTNRNSYLLLWGIDPTVKKIDYGKADAGKWFMGQNKDANVISYTSPCSRGPGTHEYVISIFALAEYPKLLPKESSVNVNFDLFMTAIEDVKIVERADLVFKVVTK